MLFRSVPRLPRHRAVAQAAYSGTPNSPCVVVWSCCAACGVCDGTPMAELSGLEVVGGSCGPCGTHGSRWDRGSVRRSQSDSLPKHLVCWEPLGLVSVLWHRCAARGVATQVAGCGRVLMCDCIRGHARALPRIFHRRGIATNPHGSQAGPEKAQKDQNEWIHSCKLMFE